MAAPKGAPTRDEFAAMARRGKVHQAVGAKRDLTNILVKKVPAVDFDIDGPFHPLAESYEDGDLTDSLHEAGLFVDDNGMGKMFVGTTPENLAAIRNAQTPLDYGRAYGYTCQATPRFTS